VFTDIITSCAGGRHNMPRAGLQVDNIFVFVRQVAPGTRSSMLAI